MPAVHVGTATCSAAPHAASAHVTPGRSHTAGMVTAASTHWWQLASAVVALLL
jgi:hypothetical protein